MRRLLQLGFWSLITSIGAIAGTLPARGELVSSGTTAILVVKGPVLFIQVQGEPVFVPVIDRTRPEEPVQVGRQVVNASHPIYVSGDTGQYLIQVDTVWLSASTLEGPYEVERRVSGYFRRLPPSTVAPELTQEREPQVIVRRQRTAVIRYEGNLQLEVVGKRGGLHIVRNTDADLFFHGQERRYYGLVGGQWYSSGSKEGPWTPTFDLPPEFSVIPPEHDKGYVLAAVPGTTVHESALQDVKRMQLHRVAASTTDSVAYRGLPVFESIDGLDVEYAVNANADVFRVGGLYYACIDGVWYLGVDPHGEWTVCAVVPDPVYAIPESHPAHRVTGVVVYPADEGGVVMVGRTREYDGWLVDDDRILHASYVEPYPRGRIIDGEYVVPPTPAAQMAPHYGNWGREDWTQRRGEEQKKADRVAAMHMDADEPQAPSTLQNRREGLEGRGAGERWMDSGTELDDRRKGLERRSGETMLR